MFVGPIADSVLFGASQEPCAQRDSADPRLETVPTRQWAIWNALDLDRCRMTWRRPCQIVPCHSFVRHPELLQIVREVDRSLIRWSLDRPSSGSGSRARVFAAFEGSDVSHPKFASSTCQLDRYQIQGRPDEGQTRLGRLDCDSRRATAEAIDAPRASPFSPHEGHVRPGPPCLKVATEDKRPL